MDINLFSNFCSCYSSILAFNVPGPIEIERENLVDEAQYKLNAHLIGGVIGFIIVTAYTNIQVCTHSMITWFLFFTIYCLLVWMFLTMFIRSNRISNLWYSVSTYPLDVVTIGLFVYGFIIFSNQSEECSIQYPFPYYVMLLVLIIQLATFLKYISWGILICICLPIVAYMVYREFRNRQQEYQAPWEDFERNVFDNLQHASYNTEIEQMYDTWSIWLLEFEKGDNIVILPCSQNHNFHKECIKQWFYRKRSCPLCQHNLDE